MGYNLSRILLIRTLTNVGRLRLCSTQCVRPVLRETHLRLNILKYGDGILIFSAQGHTDFHKIVLYN